MDTTLISALFSKLAAQEYAPGIPSKKEYGDISSLKPGQIVDLYVQRHLAERAGEHRDVRLGTPDIGLLSWAVRKGLPEIGKKHLAVQQPLHTHKYGPFEGEIEEGYGKGKVISELQGRALITKLDPDGMTFVTAHERYPQRFRIQQTEDKNWLLINVTPGETVEEQKAHYTSLSPEEVEKVFTPSNIVQAKVDGSSQIVNILKDKMESLSYRTSKVTGGPIVHTERAGLHKYPVSDIPRATLKAELYGEYPSGKAIPASELGGLLNTSIERSLSKQQEQGIKLKHMLFDILAYKGKNLQHLPYKERLKILQEVADKLNPEVFPVAKGYTDPKEQRKLWQDIKEGKDPLTTEGIVAHPSEVVGKPTKVKLDTEADVYIQSPYKGTGKYKDSAGGFVYSLTPTGNPVGRVGTGLSDMDRKDLWENPDNWVGRKVRILAQEQFPSGAYRAPRFVARHEG